MNNGINYKAFTLIILCFFIIGTTVRTVSAQEKKVQKALEVRSQGIELWSQGKFKQAADKFREAIKIDNTNATIYYDLGKLLMEELQLYDDAIDAFKLATVKETNHWRSYYNLAKAYAAKNDCKKAIEFYLKTKEVLERKGQLTDSYRTAIDKRLTDCNYAE